ncbi:MAG: NAD(P)/FAD-dependent oxidoreductase [Chloroherpetonaceae bacterium]|nr:NAD(P)/FAD-dependent oxidoreductase [Chloroherpetonaceae bacterium]
MHHEYVVIGSGIGGLSAAALLAKEGKDVLLIEAESAIGGCASSYHIKRPDGNKFKFESGATTIVGLAENQPLRTLEEKLEIKFPVVELNPSMTIHFKQFQVTRVKDKNAWITECFQKFFSSCPELKNKHDEFWNLAFSLNDLVWRVSKTNVLFPPLSISDLLRLAQNNKITDFPKLRFLFESTLSVMTSFGLHVSDSFVRFCDEQLMITAQAKTDQVPFLYAAPCLTYTNTENFYAYGGMIRIAETLRESIIQNGGKIITRQKVNGIQRRNSRFILSLSKGFLTAKKVISNATLWNTYEMLEDALKPKLKHNVERIPFGWGAFTMGIAINDTLHKNLTLHHQFHLESKIPFTNSDSYFLSLSMPDDFERHPESMRVMAISTHTKTNEWFKEEMQYKESKAAVEEFILSDLETRGIGFSRESIVFKNSSTPKTWQDWTHRKFGRVGGVPNTLSRSVFELTGSKGLIEGLYFVGDTVYPGQGIAGVALSGINAVERIKADES